MKTPQQQRNPEPPAGLFAPAARPEPIALKWRRHGGPVGHYSCEEHKLEIARNAHTGEWWVSYGGSMMGSCLTLADAKKAAMQIVENLRRS